MNLAKTYEPQAYEGEIYELWERSGAFAPTDAKERFSMVVPPPNANNNLHVGASYFIALDDILSRYYRMKGRSTLLVPGADHAGLETWVVYEKKLHEKGESRLDYSRDELYSQVWDFVAENRAKFDIQYRQHGASCDWDRFTFTLDEKVVKGAYKIFKKMWDEGLIYRSRKPVNYCVVHQTAFSGNDYEVEHVEQEDKMYEIAYPLEAGGEVIVATVRPETLFGDVAVAVNPKDDRYKDIVGKNVKLPITGRLIPVIADTHVDMEFGTGCLKTTPGHSAVDWEIASAHGLADIEVIGLDGKISDSKEVPEELWGMEVIEARAQTVRLLEGEGSLRSAKAYNHSIAVCYKCKTTVEPLLLEQWFIDMKPLAKRAIEAIEKNEVEFYPAKRKQYAIEYLSGLRDWNISRQIPWGIPIPAFQAVDDPTDWIFDDRVAEGEVIVEGKKYRRDPDVFDTWFSSSQFPYLALGWADDSEDFKKFFPLDLMIHGSDIFNPWGMRMIMMSLYVFGEVPFKKLYIHGMIRDAHGRKMSKSLGNGVNPNEVISEYGSDAIRLIFPNGEKAGAHKNFDIKKVVEGRNFCNKLWNIARFIENLLDSKGISILEIGLPEPKTAVDNWILGEVASAVEKVENALESLRFGEAYEEMYGLVWNKLADWYVEASKQELNLSVLGCVFEAVLKLVHPFAPFVTEAIWQSLGFEGDESMLVTSKWPEKFEFDTKEAEKFEGVIVATEFARRVKTYAGADMEISAPDDSLAELAKGLAKLKGGDGLTESLNITGLEAWSLMLSDENLTKYRNEIGKRVDEVQAKIKNLETRLGNESYVKNAPEELVSESKEELERLEEELAELKKE